MRICTFTLIGLAIVSTVAGCSHGDSKQEQARLNTVSTPLPIDPTDKIEIGPWWSDGQHMLNLRADGGYSIYDNNNRYSKPLDRGRWGRQNYATLWLEPYTTLHPERIRVQVTEVDDRYGLIVPKYKTMFALAAPPAVMEDHLVGDWQGAMGSLTINDDMTYTFAPLSSAKTSSGKAMAGHSGRWMLTGEKITLTPNSPTVSAVTITVRQPAAPATPEGTAPGPAGDPSLEGFGGTLAKAKTPGT